MPEYFEDIINAGSYFEIGVSIEGLKFINGTRRHIVFLVFLTQAAP